MSNVVASALGFVVVWASAAHAGSAQETAPRVAPAQSPAPQEPPPKLTPPKLPGDAAAGAAAKPLVGSDGLPLVRGALPANTDPAARDAWQKALAATVLAGGERAPIASFELVIDAIVKPSESGINKIQGLYQYLAPNCVRTRVSETGREYVRGPDGDYLVDPAREGAVKIGNERESEQDRRQIEIVLAIAQNFVALTDPKALRIASLAKLAAAPAGLPPKFEKRAAELVWLDVTSPDFRLTRAAQTNGGERLYRVQLGLAPDTSLPALALLHDGVDATALAPSTVFLELARWEASGGYKVPRQLNAYEIASGTPLRFGLDPSTDVFVKSATINPPLTPDSFRPVVKAPAFK